MKYHAYTLDQYVRELAGGEATPGGGSAAALVGTLGAALVSMVGNLTIGRKKYAAVQEQMEQLIADAVRVQEEMLNLVSEDTEVFEMVMAAYKLPKATDEEKAHRQDAINEALRTACSVPLRTADAAIRVLRLARFAAEHGNTNAISDAAVAGLTAQASLESALLNVRINLKALPQDDWSGQTATRVHSLRAEGASLLSEVITISDRVLGS